MLKRIQQHPWTAFYFSTVSFHEQTLGAHNYVNRAHSLRDLTNGYDLFDQIRASYAAMQVLPFDQGAAIVFDSLRSRRLGVGTMDLRIAAIGLSRNFTVLTRNLADFRLVPGLMCEDWTV
jgi:tRNA(fMet)-specific endonuclease VapC